MRRICWPWCQCRKERRAIRRQISGIDWVEIMGGRSLSEGRRRDALIARLRELEANR